MEKEGRRLRLGATPFLCLLITIPLLYFQFFYLNYSLPFHPCKCPLGLQQNSSDAQASLSSITRKVPNGVEEHKESHENSSDEQVSLSSNALKFDNGVEEHNGSLDFLLRRLVRGEDRKKLEATGFACDAAYHSVVCVVSKPVKVDTNTMTVHQPSDDHSIPQGQSLIRPYARQEDENLLKYISPVNIVYEKNTAPACDYTHDVPAVIFSSGGFTGNLFHEFNEIIIPLFITSRHFESRVQFVLVDYKPSFVNRYNRIFQQLTRNQILNPATNQSVHCFPGAVAGLKFHKFLAINSSDIPGGYSMFEFKQFLRKSYSLKVNHASEIQKPVLLLISREKTRKFLKEDLLVGLMEELGFQVVVARPKMMSNLDQFAKLVGSCSVMVGAHGAGLAHELFLPVGAVVVQVVPLGLDWASTAYFGEPAPGMGLHYLEYKINPEESSLINSYGRDHQVIVEPALVFSKDFQAGRAIYVDGQNMKINLVRFRETLVEHLDLLGVQIFEAEEIFSWCNINLKIYRINVVAT